MTALTGSRSKPSRRWMVMQWLAGFSAVLAASMLRSASGGAGMIGTGVLSGKAGPR
jgi:hypothetical protein